jgi:malonyl-CoA/methylmalonyl-CoA synthetase
VRAVCKFKISQGLTKCAVTFLSILAHNAIALPLSQAFPSSELRYIIENSEAALFVATTKFKEKAEDVLNEEIIHKPQLEVLETIDIRATSAEGVKIEQEACTDDGGFMLYTSGTTSRPVKILSLQ